MRAKGLKYFEVGKNLYVFKYSDVERLEKPVHITRMNAFI